MLGDKPFPRNYTIRVASIAESYNFLYHLTIKSNKSYLIKTLRLNEESRMLCITKLGHFYLNETLTWPDFLTMILSECLSATPRTYVATQYPAHERVNSSIALLRLTSDWLWSLSQAVTYHTTHISVTSYSSIIQLPTLFSVKVNTVETLVT